MENTTGTFLEPGREPIPLEIRPGDPEFADLLARRAQQARDRGDEKLSSVLSRAGVWFARNINAGCGHESLIRLASLNSGNLDLNLLAAQKDWLDLELLWYLREWASAAQGSGQTSLAQTATVLSQEVEKLLCEGRVDEQGDVFGNRETDPFIALCRIFTAANLPLAILDLAQALDRDFFALASILAETAKEAHVPFLADALSELQRKAYLIKGNAQEKESLTALAASIAMERGEIEVARSLLLRLMREEPGSAYAPVELANLAILSNDAAAASAYMEAAEPLVGNDTDLLNKLGVCHATTGNPEKASAIFQRVLSADPVNLDALQNLITILAEAGRIPEACSLSDAALKVNSTDISLLIQSGLLNAMTGNLDVARQKLDDAQRLAPGSEEVHEARKQLMALTGES